LFPERQPVLSNDAKVTRSMTQTEPLIWTSTHVCHAYTDYKSDAQITAPRFL